MIAILVATRLEARYLLQSLAPVKQEGIFHYRGQIAGKPVVLFLTRPGVYSQEQVRRFLRLYPTDLVLMTGACAALTSELHLFQPALIAAATNPDKKWFTVGDTGYKCVSVGHLVSDDTTKQLLRDRTGADVLDMETWTLAKILSEPEFATRRAVALRVVGDLPGETLLLEKERKLRELAARTPSGRLGFATLLRFGVWDFLWITLRRRRIAAAIARAVTEVIRGKWPYPKSAQDFHS